MSANTAWYDAQPATRDGKRPKYLDDLNYYRLAYQSAADRLNVLIDDVNNLHEAEIPHPSPHPMRAAVSHA